MTGVAAAGGRKPRFFAAPLPSRPGASVGEAIHEAFVITGSPAQVFVVQQVASIVGTILGFGLCFSAVASAGTAPQRIGLAGIGAAGLLAGQLAMRRSRVPLWVMDAMLVFAAATLGVVGTFGGPLQAALPAVYVTLGTSVFLIRSLQTSLSHLVALGASYSVVLWFGPHQDAPVTRWFAVMAAVLISGLFVRWLVAQVTALATAEQAARRDVEEATGELELQSEAKSRFLARMSHELRTPLNVIVGFSDVLQDGLVGPMNEHQHAYVQDIAGSGRDLLSLVDELLDESKVEMGTLDLDLRATDVGKAVADAQLIVKESARQAGVDLTVSVPTVPVLADADALRIRQVSWNLIGNAVKFTPRGGKVRVVVSERDDRVVVAVHDTGPGIAPEDQERVFQKYERGSSAEAGSGIGLALSRRLIEAHGGRLSLESEPGQGSTFSFELPRRRRLDATDEESAPVPVHAHDVGAELVQGILVPGSHANRKAMAQVGQWFSTSATVLLAVVAIITPGPLEIRAAVLGMAVCSAAASWALARLGHGLAAGATRFLGSFGIVAVSIGTLIAGPFDDVVPLAYGWMVVATAALLTPRRVADNLLGIGLCYVVVLLISQPTSAFDRWLAVMMLVSSNAVVISWVAGRLREVMSEALGARMAAEATRSRVAAISAHKSDFLASTSHELCTPLNAIIGFAHLLKDDTVGPLEPKQAGYVDDILESGHHLLALITDLLELAKLEAGRAPATHQEISVSTFVDTVVGELTSVAARRDVRLLVDVPEDLPLIEGDPGHLHQALANLLDNAIKFTPDGGRVDVMARSIGDRVLLSVRDTGIGILPDQRPHLFDAFHQGSRPLPEHARGGTGLGLTLAMGLVALEGGGITVESTPDIGSTFTISLPVPVPAAADATPVEAER